MAANKKIIQPIRYSLDDVLENMTFKTNNDKIITKDIITQIEEIAFDGIEKNLCMSIPYLGRLRKSIFQRLMKEEGAGLLKDAKTKLSKEDYIEYRRNLYRSYRIKAKDEDYAKLIIERIIRLNKKKYNQIYSACGKDYADRWIKKIAYLKIIEHD